jgi:hypothetical protein
MRSGDRWTVIGNLRSVGYESPPTYPHSRLLLVRVSRSFAIERWAGLEGLALPEVPVGSLDSDLDDRRPHCHQAAHGSPPGFWRSSFFRAPNSSWSRCSPSRTVLSAPTVR